MKKLEQKQIPQFVALCILSSGVFGYFVMRMVTPSPASASSVVHPSAPATARTAAPSAGAASAPTATNAATASTATPVAAGTLAASGDPALLVPPPTPGMRDPFVVGYVDPKVDPKIAAALPAAPPRAAASSQQLARTTLPGLSAFTAPVVPTLPSGLSGLTVRQTRMAAALPTVPPLPAAPAPPAWVVTGVLQTDTEKLAILRNGEARRIVHSGDFVDSVYRVADVTRSWVVLRHGAMTYRLLLGGDKPAPGLAVPAASFGAPPTFMAPPMFTAPPGRPAPARRPGLPDAAALKQGGRSLNRLARFWLRTSPAINIRTSPLGHDVCRRSALHAAAGPEHHHGRGDARPGNGYDRY